MSNVALLLVAAGVLLLLVAAAGLFLLPDALARQHAATKSGTLALGLILAGTAIHAADAAWTWRVVVILALLIVTLPVASHMLARAAARHAYRPEELENAPDADASGRPPDSSGRR